MTEEELTAKRVALRLGATVTLELGKPPAATVRYWEENGFTGGYYVPWLVDLRLDMDGVLHAVFRSVDNDVQHIEREVDQEDLDLAGDELLGWAWAPVATIAPTLEEGDDTG